MPVAATTRYAKASDVYDFARAMMNDPNGVIWSDATLLTFLNGAYRSLQETLAINGVSVMLAYADLDLPLTTIAGTTLAPNPARIADDTDPQLPTDCILPYTLSEKPTGSSTKLTPMEMLAGPLPDFDAQPYLRIWKWETDQIELVGATQAVTVRIHYERALPAIAESTDPVAIPHCKKAIAYEVAAMAARSRGARQLAADMLAASQNSTNALIQRYTHQAQYKVIRKKPYGHRRRVIYL